MAVCPPPLISYQQREALPSAAWEIEIPTGSNGRERQARWI